MRKCIPCQSMHSHQSDLKGVKIPKQNRYSVLITDAGNLQKHKYKNKRKRKRQGKWRQKRDQAGHSKSKVIMWKSCPRQREWSLEWSSPIATVRNEHPVWVSFRLDHIGLHWKKSMTESVTTHWNFSVKSTPEKTTGAGKSLQKCSPECSSNIFSFLQAT